MSIEHITKEEYDLYMDVQAKEDRSKKDYTGWLDGLGLGTLFGIGSVVSGFIAYDTLDSEVGYVTAIVLGVMSVASGVFSLASLRTALNARRSYTELMRDVEEVKSTPKYKSIADFMER